MISKRVSKIIKAVAKPVKYSQNEMNYFGVKEGDERKPL